MRKNLWVRGHLFTPLGAVSAALAVAISAEAQSAAPLQQVRVAVDSASLYAAPHEGASKIGSVLWLQELGVDPKWQGDANDKWLPVLGTDGKKASKGKGPRPDAWIRREDVVLAQDYRAVVGCWPVKSLSYTAGDYSIEIAFSPEGMATVKTWGDEPSVNRRAPQAAHVYLARDVAVVVGSINAQEFLTAGFRADSGRLYPVGGQSDEQLVFQRGELAGCAGAPLLSSKRLATQAGSNAER